jgi:hypothetical protein
VCLPIPTIVPVVLLLSRLAETLPLGDMAKQSNQLTV